MDFSDVARQTSEPYVGLRPFRSSESRLFFGRKRESHELADLWQANKLTILHGPSGVGKSSLLQAGVLPLVTSRTADALPIGRVSRGPLPSAILPRSGNPYVFALLASWSPHTPPSQLATMTMAEFLSSRPTKTDMYGDPLLTLVAVDQAEDLFGDFARQRPHCEEFLRQLTEALDQVLHIRLLVTISDDHLTSLLQYGHGLATRSKAMFPLKSLGTEAAVEACVGPLRETSRAYAPGAADALVTDLRTVRLGRKLGDEVVEVRDTVEPVQLQVVCTALWRKLAPEHLLITATDVRRLANADDALADYCNRAIEEVAHDHFHGEADQLRLRLRRIFISDLGARETVYRGMTETAGLPNAVIRALAAWHILRLEEDPISGWCRLAHDRLVRPILRGGPVKRGDDIAGPEDYLRSAEIALSDGQYRLAAKHAEEALRHCGDDIRLQAETQSLLGNIAYLAADPDEAIAHYRTAVELFAALRGTGPVIATLLAVIGQIKIDQGEVTAALQELRAAVRQNPADLGIQIKLAWALWHSGRPTAAVDVLDNVLNVEGNTSEALRARGEMRADLGEPEKAIRDLDRTRPHHLPSTRAAYALVLALKGDTEAALDALPSTADEQDASVLLRAARVHAAAGHQADAARLATRARQTSARPPLPPHLLPIAKTLV